MGLPFIAERDSPRHKAKFRRLLNLLLADAVSSATAAELSLDPAARA